MIKIKKKICKYSLKYVISDLLNVVERDQDDQDQDQEEDQLKWFANTYSRMSSVTSSMWLKERSSQAISSGASTRSRASCEDLIWGEYGKFWYAFLFSFQLVLRYALGTIRVCRPDCCLPIGSRCCCTCARCICICICILAHCICFCIWLCTHLYSYLKNRCSK